MTPFLRGSLVEYEPSQKNCMIISSVDFQFNPEKIQRSFQIANRPTDKNVKDAKQAGEDPVEKLSLVIYFNAADFLHLQQPISQAFGVAPQLALLERYAKPVDGDGAKSQTFTDPVTKVAQKKSTTTTNAAERPSQQYASLLFVWGEEKILPVAIESLAINEVQFDARLNPTQAEVNLSLSVIMRPATNDGVAQGALDFTAMKNKNKIEEWLKKQSSAPPFDTYKL